MPNTGAGNAGTNASARHQPAGDPQRIGTRDELQRQIDAERAFAGDARHHEPHRRRDQERGQRRHERVADGENRVGLERLERSEPVIGDADDDPAGEIERDDDERRDRVAFDWRDVILRSILFYERASNERRPFLTIATNPTPLGEMKPHPIGLRLIARA